MRVKIEQSRERAVFSFLIPAQQALGEWWDTGRLTPPARQEPVVIIDNLVVG